MDFLRECAAALDGGEAGEEVLRRLRERYRTAACLSSKASVVRSLCGDPEAARRLRVPRETMLECKRASAHAAKRKNFTMLCVDGRALLREARGAVADPDGAPLASLVFALTLLTGRRTCEVLSHRSRFLPAATPPHACSFEGQAKRRGDAGGYVIPLLVPDARVVARAHARLLERVTSRDREGLTHRQALSRSYQSWLRRSLLAHAVYAQVRGVHALRGVYACICPRLFAWDRPYSPAYITMHVLGHTSLHESLVYTTYHLGDGFGAEPALGPMSLPDPPSLAPPAAPRVGDPDDVAEDGAAPEGGPDDGL